MTSKEIDKATTELRDVIVQRTQAMMFNTTERIERASFCSDSNDEIAAGHKMHKLRMRENERWLCGELEKLRMMRSRLTGK